MFLKQKKNAWRWEEHVPADTEIPDSEMYPYRPPRCVGRLGGWSFAAC